LTLIDFKGKFLEINYINYFSFKRLINLSAAVLSFVLSRIIRRPVVWGLPPAISVEPTNRCNLKCPECPSGTGKLTRPIGLLSLDDFKDFVDQVCKKSFYLQLFFQGEPYINKNLSEMTRYARQKNMYVAVSTNGLLLKGKNVDEMLKNPPDKLIFSVDGLDQQTYEIYRQGGRLSEVKENLSEIIKKKRELNLKKPYIELQFIVMKQNEHQIDDVINFGRNEGCDKVVLKTMQVGSYENALMFLPENQKFSRYSVADGELKIKSRLKNHCFALWRLSVVTWDGKVVPCCFDKDAKYEAGSLSENKFEDIWKGIKYNNFRQAVLNSRKNIDICRNCTEGLKINIGDY